MKIREARISDLNNIKLLMKKNEELKNSADAKYFNKKYLTSMIKDKYTYLIVAENNSIEGLLGAAIWKNEGVSYLDFIFVNKHSRRLGIGKKLYEEYLEYLKKLNINYFWTLVSKEDYKLQKFAEKLKMKKDELYYFYDRKLK
jgi:ribosomal protein S18 acetylase RimI-like enzyme